MTSNSNEISRSPLMMNRDNTALVVIDVQEKLVPAIHRHEMVTWNIGRLIRGLKQMDVPVIATEQYPKGLGSTVEPLKSMLPTPVPEKLMFSCRECGGEFGELQSRGVHNLLVTGIESHVCVLQSTLDFLSMGFDVFVVVDAIG